MIWFLWFFLIFVGVAFIAIGHYCKNDAWRIIGVVFIFLLALNFMTEGVDYKKGYNATGTDEVDPIFQTWVNGINVSNSSLANYMLRTGTNSNITYLSFNTSVTPTLAEGQMAYDFNNNALSIGYPLGTTLQVGQEMYKVVTNLDSITLPEGTPVSIIGVSGNREAIKRTNISNHTNSHGFIGLVTSANCTINQKCLVTTFGDVHNLNTAALTEGTMLYVNSTGGLTNTIPDAPLHVVEVGKVTVSNINNGIIALTAIVTPDLSELSDVDGTPINTTGQILVWNETRKVWDATANINNFVLNSTLSDYVPYTGATGNVNLNGKNLTNISYLGIGTTGPTQALDIIGRVQIANNETDGASKYAFLMGRSRNNSDGSWLFLTASGESTNKLEWGGGSATYNSAQTQIFYTGTNTTTRTGTERMRITSAGRVGIGTPTPSSRLNVYRDNTTSDGNLELTGDKIYPSFVSSSASDTAFHGTFFSMYRARGGQSAKTSVQTGDTIFSYDNWAYNGSENLRVLQLKGLVEQVNATTGDVGGYWAFATSNSKTGENDIERMRVNQEGNVGIGTTSPTNKLEINAGSNLNALKIIPNISANVITVNQYGTIGMTQPTTAGENSAFGLGSSGDTFQRLSFGLNSGLPYLSFGNGSSARDVSITRTTDNSLSIVGNVGIGTTSPNTKLDVNGSSSLGNKSGNITISSSGNLILNGVATQWDDMTVPLTLGRTAGLHIPSFETFMNGTMAYAFIPDDEIYVTQQMSHSYATNTTIYQHVHVSPSTTNTGNVTICIEYTKADIYGVFPSTTTSCGTAYMNGTKSSHILVMDGSIGNFSGLSGIVNARVYRNTSTIGSAYADKLFILAYDMHYQKNSLGSDEELVK